MTFEPCYKIMKKSIKNEEIDLIRERYEKRNICNDVRYNPLNPSVYMSKQEKERALIRVLKKINTTSLEEATLLEIGCGSGLNLLQFMRLGFSPENLFANELLKDRMDVADHNLPRSIQRLPGDATTLDIKDQSYDIVFQSTVFSSILNDNFQDKLASEMWRWIRPGGGVLWYDFVYNNPNNVDVKGVDVRRIQSLFPDGVITMARITLAPPISRRVCAIHPSLYTIFNMFPFLRTHVLCWIKKKNA